MTKILLIYPFFKPRRDRSVFRFPPLGISTIATVLQKAGHDVTLLDCTFLSREDAYRKALEVQAEIVGIYCMVTMMDDCLGFARTLRKQTRFMVAGGPLPTCDPDIFLDHFDVIVQGEGEQTVVDLIDAYIHATDLSTIPGITFREVCDSKTKIIHTPERIFIGDLDKIPFPARNLLPNEQYIRYAKKKYGYSITTVMTTRGCPFRCEFCSNVIFGGSFRERSPGNVVDEIEDALGFGYERISFADDVFTMKKERVALICDEIISRGLKFKWECLGRVDALDASTAARMKQAGCTRIYFGIESGNDRILQLMNKKITPEQARQAVMVAHNAGLEVGAFFILFYPGDTQETVIQTIHFATTLPLDYLGLSMPYPLPGTALFHRVKDRLHYDGRLDAGLFGSHVLTFNSDFSELKIWFGIIKGHAQFRIKKGLGKLAPIILTPFERTTDWLFKWMK
jgi:anaerobic magnesium-protoporphyrin IX monomethyl ester cyclase